MMRDKVVVTLTLTCFYLLLPVVLTEDGVCSTCPINKYCTDALARNCPPNSESPIQSKSHFDCTCTAGYSGSKGGPCTACPAGSYKTQNNSSCISCPVDTSSGVGSTSCSSCPTNMTIDVNDVSKCSCQKGYGFDGLGACQACITGQFKNTVSNESCSACVSNSITKISAATSATDCFCVEGFEMNTEKGLCECVAGHEFVSQGNIEFCSPCSTNTYKSSPGNEMCTMCTQNTETTSQAATECACKHGYDRNIESGSCQCAPRYGSYDISRSGIVTCTMCPSGTYKSTSGNGRCTNCEPNTYSADPGNLNCNLCGIHSSVPYSGADSCLCDAGYTYDMDIQECLPCDSGLFKNRYGNFECSPCPISRYTDVQGMSNCSQCQANTSTTSVGTDSVHDCMCGVGYGYNATTSLCLSCPDDSYKVNVSNGTCELKTEDGYYIRLRLAGMSSASLTESDRQIIINIVAGPLNIDPSFVKIMTEQDITSSSTTRRLLQESEQERAVLVLIFVDSSTVDIVSLNETTVNQYMRDNYDDQVLPYVVIDGSDFVQDSKFNPTVVIIDTINIYMGDSESPSMWVMVSIVAGGVSFLVIVTSIVLTWYYCRKSTAVNTTQNRLFEQSISIPELSQNKKDRCLDVADFYKFSRRSIHA